MNGYYIVKPETYIISSIIIAVLPALVLLTYYASKDKGENEPRSLMLKVFFGGIVAVIPVALFEIFFDGFLGGIDPFIYAFLSPFLFVALPEEFAKFFVVKTVAYNHHKFDEVMDGITYTVLASMGFAVFENLSYTYEFGLDVALLRSITAVPAHALFSGIMGYYIGHAKFTKGKRASRYLLVKGVMAGVMFHGIYDFLLLSGVSALVVLVFPMLVYMWHVLEKAITLAHGTHPKPLKFL